MKQLEEDIITTLKAGRKLSEHARNQREPDLDTPIQGLDTLTGQ